MKLLYVASDQRVPGTTGGSVHVEEVAMGLAARGHDVHVVALPGKGAPDERLTLHPSPMWLAHRAFRWSARGPIGALLDELSVDAIIERYYNFGGEGVRAADERNVPVLLEVNSPLTEPPGSLKSRLDRLMVIAPMAKLRDEICKKASAFVTPLPSILPQHIPAEKVHRVSWGANVERFRPDVGRHPISVPEDKTVVVFSGSFRPWHGADILVRAAAKLPRAFFLFVGDGPSLSDCRDIARKLGIEDRVLFTGAVPYNNVPAYLAWADIGVAPYQPSRLGQMQLGFYWSPLKIFEYMAMGLPVVSLDVPPLREVVRPREGRLVPEGDPDRLADALGGMLGDVDARKEMGRSARERVVEHYSWGRHCEQLERILVELVSR